MTLNVVPHCIRCACTYYYIILIFFFYNYSWKHQTDLWMAHIETECISCLVYAKYYTGCLVKQSGNIWSRCSCVTRPRSLVRHEYLWAVNDYSIVTANCICSVLHCAAVKGESVSNVFRKWCVTREEHTHSPGALWLCAGIPTGSGDVDRGRSRDLSRHSPGSGIWCLSFPSEGNL